MIVGPIFLDFPASSVLGLGEAVSMTAHGLQYSTERTVRLTGKLTGTLPGMQTADSPTALYVVVPTASAVLPWSLDLEDDLTYANRQRSCEDAISRR